jgi:D-inositol-3-phosphate glycosyltransferase
MNRGLRILMLSLHSSPFGELGTTDTGGMSVYIREISRELGRLGHSVDIFTVSKNGYRHPIEKVSENVRLIHIGNGKFSNISKYRLYSYTFDIYAQINEFIMNNSIEYDLIHSNYWISGHVGTIIQEKWNIPHITMYHTNGLAKRINCLEEQEPLIRILTEKRISESCQKILVTTHREKEWLKRLYGVPLDKIRLIPCGVDTNKFRPIPQKIARRWLNINDTDPLLLYVGRFSPIKGLGRLILSMAYLRDIRGIRLMVIGGEINEIYNEMKRLVRNTGVDSMVYFGGRVDHNLLPLYYNAADMLVIPSYYESFGLVALEALACGVPVVATSVGAMERIIIDGYNGLIVKDPSPRSISESIRLMLRMKDSLSSDQIRNTVLQHDWTNITRSIIKEYFNLKDTRLRACLNTLMSL